MNFFEYEASMEQIFIDMFVKYFMDDLEMELTEEVIKTKICTFIIKAREKGLVSICMAYMDALPVGFGIYQIDSPEKDWCKREGWGFIREFCIAPAYRKLGCGRAMATYILERLRAMGAYHVYLTADDAVTFWKHCGFSDTGEVCQNGTKILIKNLYE